jgi:hypothetical protein
MKRFLPRLCALALLGLAACGGTDETFTLSSGTYALTTKTVSKDDCKLVSVPTPVTITVSGTTVTVTDIGGQPSGTLQGNDASLASVHTVDNNTAASPAFNCVEKITKTIAISLTANDKLSGTQQYRSEIDSGNACTLANLGYTVPCESTIEFEAVKQ